MNTNNSITNFLVELASDMERKSQETSTMSFSELSARAAALPNSAYKHRAWWANHGLKPWLKAGLRTEAVDMERRVVTFRRFPPSTPQFTKDDVSQDVPTDFHENVRRFRFRAEPDDQDRPHPLIGVLRGKIRMADDLDLTAPTDPDWGRVYDE